MAKNTALQQRNQLKNLLTKFDIQQNTVLVFHESLKDQIFKMVNAGAFKGMPVVPFVFAKDMNDVKLNIQPVQPYIIPTEAVRYKAFAMVRKPSPSGSYPSLYVMREFIMEGDRVIQIIDSNEDLSGVVMGRIQNALEDGTQ